MNIITGAIILVIVIWIYVAVSYVAHNKGGSCGSSCDGNCASCGVSCSSKENETVKNMQNQKTQSDNSLKEK